MPRYRRNKISELTKELIVKRYGPGEETCYRPYVEIKNFPCLVEPPRSRLNVTSGDHRFLTTAEYASILLYEFSLLDADTKSI